MERGASGDLWASVSLSLTGARDRGPSQRDLWVWPPTHRGTPVTLTEGLQCFMRCLVGALLIWTERDRGGQNEQGRAKSPEDKSQAT